MTSSLWGLKKNVIIQKVKCFHNSETSYLNSTVEQRQEEKKKHGGQEAEGSLPVTRASRKMVDLCKK